MADDGDQHLGGEAEDGGEGGGGGGEGHDLLPKDQLVGGVTVSGRSITVRRCLGNVNFSR